MLDYSYRSTTPWKVFVETVKKLNEYLDFVYSRKENVTGIYDVCEAFYRTMKLYKSQMNYFMNFKKIYEELNELMPFSIEIYEQ